MFRHVIETGRRFYLANNVDVATKEANGAVAEGVGAFAEGRQPDFEGR